MAQADAKLRLLRARWAAPSEGHARPAFVQGLALPAKYQAARVLAGFMEVPPASATEEAGLAQHWMPGILRQACLLQPAAVFGNEGDLHNWAKMENVLGPRRLLSPQFQFLDGAAAALHWFIGSDAAVQRPQAERPAGPHRPPLA